jgi:hypothetical protein
MFSRRGFVRMMLVGAGFVLLGDLLPQLRKSTDPVPIGDGLVIVDGWILRADEAATVFA